MTVPAMSMMVQAKAGLTVYAIISQCHQNNSLVLGIILLPVAPTMMHLTHAAIA